MEKFDVNLLIKKLPSIEEIAKIFQDEISRVPEWVIDKEPDPKWICLKISEIICNRFVVEIKKYFGEE